MSATVQQMPEPATPDATRSLCPPWCEDQDRAGHWENIGDVWQVVHTRHFAHFAAYLPEEVHSNGTNWVGRCEVHTDEVQEVVFYASETLALADHLRDAARFARRIDEQVAAAGARGIIATLTETHPKAEASPATTTETTR